MDRCPVFVSWETYKRIEEGVEILALTCPKGHNLVKLTKEAARLVLDPAQKVGVPFCPECSTYKQHP